MCGKTSGMDDGTSAHEENYSQIEACIAQWAAARPDLRAGIAVGSRARADGTADQWSDLDLVFFAEDPQEYCCSGDWLEDFGELWASYLDHSVENNPEWFAVYAGGLKVDISFAAAGGQDLVGMLSEFAFQDVIQRGVRVLFDKTSTQANPFPPHAEGQQAAQPSLPSAAEFAASASRFWITAARAAKLACRGDLWRAKETADCGLKSCLLEMLAWHARSAYNPQADTWYEGRFLAGWADPRALKELPDTIAAYDQADLQHALRATIALYHRLAGEAADALGVPYPLPSHLHLQNWLLDLLESNSPLPPR